MKQSDRTSIDLPIKRCSLLSHTANIDFGIQTLSERPGYVIGYRMVRGWETREMFHEVVPESVAESFSGRSPDYRYSTLDDLLLRKEEIEKGKFKVRNGMVVGVGSSYSQN